MGRFEGKVAFITGAARGQGRSHAVRLAEEGCSIIGIDVCQDIATAPYPGATSADLKETTRLVESVGGQCFMAEADVRDLAALEQIVADGVQAFGRLDIVIANAGIASFAPALEMTEQMWSVMIDINLTGVWKTIKASVPAMIEAGHGGSVIITSSVGATYAHENVSHYSAAKAGLVQFMRVLAKEFAPHNIRVNTVHPTSCATDMVLNEATFNLFLPDDPNPTREKYEAAHSSLHVLKVGLIEPIDVSNAIVYLASDDGRYVTGTTHMISAGGHI